MVADEELRIQEIRVRFEALRPVLDERQLRLWAAAEAKALGHCGVATVTRAWLGQVIDERGRRGEARVEATLDGAVRDGDREVRLAAPYLAAEDDNFNALLPRRMQEVPDAVGRSCLASRGSVAVFVSENIPLIDCRDKAEPRHREPCREAWRVEEHCNEERQ